MGWHGVDQRAVHIENQGVVGGQVDHYRSLKSREWQRRDSTSQQLGTKALAQISGSIYTGFDNATSSANLADNFDRVMGFNNTALAPAASI